MSASPKIPGATSARQVHASENVIKSPCGNKTSKFYKGGDKPRRMRPGARCSIRLSLCRRWTHPAPEITRTGATRTFYRPTFPTIFSLLTLLHTSVFSVPRFIDFFYLTCSWHEKTGFIHSTGPRCVPNIGVSKMLFFHDTCHKENPTLHCTFLATKRIYSLE